MTSSEGVPRVTKERCVDIEGTKLAVVQKTGKQGGPAPCALDRRTVAGRRAQSASTHIVSEKVVRRRNVVSDRSAATGGCRDNPLQKLAPRRRGSRVPFPSCSGFFGPPPLFALMQPTLVWRVLLLWQLPRSLSLRDASPGSESSPPGRLSGRRPCARSAIARCR